MKITRLCFLLAIFGASCNNNTDKNGNTIDYNNSAPPSISYTIVKVYPHDTSSYTEGLEWRNNSFYESGGNYGKSKLSRYSLEGKNLQSIPLTKEYFGEGITLFNGKIYQLTYREHKVFVYDSATFKKVGEFEWPYEGWGMTNDGKHLIIDTGGSILYFIDPETFKILNQVSVNNNYGPVSSINELEYVDNFIYANVYETDTILKIDPQNGNVVGVLDMSGLLQKSGMPVNLQNYNNNTGNVLNGIAYDSEKNTFYITGKLWPALFEIKLNN